MTPLIATKPIAEGEPIGEDNAREDTGPVDIANLRELALGASDGSQYEIAHALYHAADELEALRAETASLRADLAAAQARPTLPSEPGEAGTAAVAEFMSRLGWFGVSEEVVRLYLAAEAAEQRKQEGPR